MARKLNKNLIGILTLSGMLLLLAIGVVLLRSLPVQDPQVYEMEAKGLEEEQEYNRAMQTYLRAYAKDPAGDPRYLVMAAGCALEDGSVATARGLLERALVRDSTLRSALELSTDLEFELAQLFGGESQWNSVLDKARKLLEVDDQSSLAHYAAGRAYWQLRGEDSSYGAEGERNLKRALELDPTNVDVVRDMASQHWMLAKDYREKGETSKAEAQDKAREATLTSAIERCSSLGEETKLIDLERQQILYMILQGSVEEGMASLEALAEKETHSADCHLLLANIYCGRVSDKVKVDLARAEQIIVDALEIDSKNVELYLFLGELYHVQGEVEKLEKLYRRGLEEIRYEHHFRSFRNNQARIEFITKLFLQDIRRAKQAGVAKDDVKSNESLASAEAWIEELKKERDEESLEVRYLVAQLLNAQGDYVGATREAEEANRVARAEHHFELQMLLSELYMRREEWGAARKMLETSLMLRPGSLQARVRLGQVYLRLGQPAAALRLLKPSEAGMLRKQLDANTYVIQLRIQAYQQLGQFDQATAESERLEQGTPDAVIQQAVILYSEGRYDEAEQKIKAVLQKEPGNVDAVKLILQLYTAADRLTDAQSLIRNLLASDPDNRTWRKYELVLMGEDDIASRDKMVEAFLKEEEDEFARAFGLYNFHRSRNRADEAAKYLEEAERLRPDSRKLIEQRFREAILAKDWETAEKYALRHGQLNLDGTEGKVVQGRLAAAKGEHERAIELIQAGLNNYPSYSLGWTYLAEVYLKVGRVMEAKNVLYRAMDVDPTNGYANKKLAEIAIQEGDEKTAQKYLEAADKFLPNDAWVKRRLRMLKEKENPQEGIVSREKIRKEDPKNLENLVLLARLYALPDVGQYDEAAEVYRESLEVSSYDLGLAREVAAFFGREEVNRPADGEALLKKLLVEEEDKAKKALIAVYIGQFYESQKALATADRHYRLAVSLDPSSDTLIRAAEFYTRTNRLRDALEYYGRALKQMDENRDLAKLTRSRVIGLLLARGDLEEAKQRIDEYIRQDPDDAQGMVFEGAYHRMGGDIQKSKEAFDAFLEKHPDNAMVLWQRGQLHILMGRWQSAISDLKKAKIFDSDGLAYQHRIALADALVEVGQDDAAIMELRSILEEKPDEKAVAEALVDVYLRVRPARHLDAESLIYTHMRREPKNLRWPMLLGALGERSNDWNKAIQGYEMAAELSRHSANVIPSLFAAYKAAGRPQDIIRFAEEKLSASMLDSIPKALSSLVWAYSRLGDKEKCFEVYDRALVASKDDFGAYTQVVMEAIATLGKEAVLTRARSRVDADPEDVEKLRALVHLLFVNGEHEEAIKVCRRIGELAVRDPERVFAALAQAMLLDALDRHAEAKAEYEEVLKLDPNQPQALNNLAYLLVEQMDSPEEALPYAERANHVSPNDPSVMDSLGWVLAKNNRLGDAVGVLLRALEIDRHNVPAAYHLGLVHAYRGEPEEAKLRLASAKEDAEAQGDTRFLPKIIEALQELEGEGDR